MTVRDLGFHGGGSANIGSAVYAPSNSSTQCNIWVCVAAGSHYGLLLSGAAAHLVHGNNFVGNATGEVFGADKIQDGFFGVTPVARRPNPGTANGLNDTQVLNNLVTSLRQLGLVL